MIKHITSRAKRLHKLLLLSLTSLSLLGLAGCTKSVKSTNLSENLTHVQVQSSSLTDTIKTQFKPALAFYIPSHRLIDLSNHDIGYYINNENTVGLIGASSDSCNAHYYAPNEQYFVQKSRKDHQQSYVPLKRSRQTIHYQINNHKKTLTLYSHHYQNRINWITYRLIHVKSDLGSGYRFFTFKPIILKRFGRRPIKVSKFISKYNKVTLKTANPSQIAVIYHRLHSNLKPYKIFHKPTLNNAK